MTMLRLRFEAGGEERTVPLAGGRLRLGRGGDNDVVLSDVSVSRHHAELRRDGNGWSVVDLQSTNGLTVNRVPVKSAPLHPGDRLGIGVFELLVETIERVERKEEEPTRPAPPFRTAPPGLGRQPAAPMASRMPGGSVAPSGSSERGAASLSGASVAPAAPGPDASAGPDVASFNATIVRPLADFSALYGLGESAPAPAASPRSQALPQGLAPPAPSRASPASTASDSAEDGYARRMLGYLTRLGRLLIRAESVDEVLARALDVAFEALPVDRGFVLLRDDEGELVCELARFKDRVEVRPTAEVPVSRTMLQAVMRERVALVTYDAQADGRLRGGESIRVHQIRAAMCAPLWSGESIVGVAQLDTPFQVGAFGERELDFLTALANTTAVAVERVRYAQKAEFERQVRSRLERYHSPALIEEVLREEAAGSLRRPQAAEATVLFADLVGFTAFSEQASPEEVAEQLGAFLSLAVEAIFAAGGTLDKFIGDCVMAFFGAPVPQPDHALRAVGAAIEIQRGLAALSSVREAEGLPALRCRVGVNSGPVVVGDIGSSRRVDYTVLGNTVNVAARLEAFVSRPGDVVLGPETHRLLAGAVPAESLGELQLKGLQQKITAYRIAPAAL